jgi:hypothetical protein
MRQIFPFEFSAVSENNSELDSHRFNCPIPGILVRYWLTLQKEIFSKEKMLLFQSAY